MLNESYELSVVDLGQVDSLANAVDALVQELTGNISLWVNHVTLARNATEDYYAAIGDDGMDLYDFVRNLRILVPNETVDSLCANVETSVRACVLGEVHGTNPLNASVSVNSTNGITLYFQSLEYYWNYSDTLYRSAGLSFVRWHQWDEFLSTYRAEFSLGHPTVLNISPTGASVSTDSSIEINFSEQMDQSTLTGAFSISPYVSGTVNTFPDKLVFVPDPGALAQGTTYKVTMFDTVTDSGGNHLGQSFTWEFTVVEQAIPEFSSAFLPILMVLSVLVAVIRHRQSEKHG